MITIGDLETLEQAGEALYRAGQNQLAIAVLSLVLRERKEINASLDTAVKLAFLCDIDESAGMAEVYELDNYSKKVWGENGPMDGGEW